MGLKFRRGTTAQKSGSLAFGEPFVNTDLNTLQIGGLSGDITLGTTGESSAFAGVSVSASSFISGSSLKITGNAAIDGNLTLGGAITIGDASSDTVNVVASLSSSLIPESPNTYDLGSVDKFWRDLYISTGSIKFVNSAGNIVGTFSVSSDGLQSSGDMYAATNVRLGKGTGTNNSLNTALGFGTLGNNTTGGSNTAVGGTALTSNTTGGSNTAVGVTTLAFNEAGSDNTAVGSQALYKNKVSANTAVGKLALHENTSGSANVAIGVGALQKITEGGFNIALGYQSGYNSSGSAASNIYIGYQAGPASNTAEANKLYINNGASDTPLIGGDFSQRELYIDGDIIPASDNQRDLGSPSYKYKDVYANNLNASVLEITSGSWAEVRLKNSSTGIDYHIQNTAGGNFSIHNAELGTSIFRIDSGSSAETSHGHFFGDLFISGNVAAGESMIAQRITGSLSGSVNGIGNVSAYSSSVNSRLVVVEGVSASAAGALNSVSGAFATTISTLGGDYATDAELSAVSAAVAVRDAAQDVLISSLQSNIVSASVFNTFSTSVDSRITTEKERVDAILLAADADKDSFAEIVTLINSVDLTNDTAFASFYTSSNATNNAQNARLSALETETGSIATAQSAQNARLTSLETTSGSHNSRLSDLEGFSSSLNSTFATDAELSSVSGAFATTIGNLGSTYATDAELNTVSGAFATTIGNLDNTYATDASVTSVSGAFATSQAAQDVLITSLRNNVVSASVFTTFSTSVDSRLDSVELVSASSAGALNSVSGAFATTIGNLDNTYATDASVTSVSGAFATTIGNLGNTYATDAELSTVSGAFATTIGNLNSTYATDAELSTVSGAFATRTAGIDNTISSLSTSVDSRLDVVEGVSASAASALNSLSSSAFSAYAKVDTANTFNGNQTITGSLYVTQDLVIGGSASIQHVTSSQLNISDNIITVNTINPTVRFGGLAVIDSGSAGISGSFLYDSVHDEFVFVHKGDGTNITSSHFLVGPETYNDLGNETYLTANKVLKSKGNEHIVESNITDTGTAITLGSNTSVTGTLVATGTSLVSASAQITLSSTTGYSTFSSSIASTIANLGTTYATDAELSTVSGAFATTIGNLGSTYATDAELSAVSAAVATRDAGQDSTISTLSSSVASRLGTLETKDITITLTGDVTGTGTITDLGNVSFATTVAANSVALGTDTTGDYVGTITAGSGLSSTGATTGEGIGHTLSIATGGVTNAMLAGSIANDKLTNSSITIAGVSTALGGTISAATIGNAIGAVSSSAQVTASVFGAVSGDVTISSTGVATIAANSVALGTDTTGNYVATITAGTGVSSTGATTGEGIAHTISIGQAVATSSNVQFNSLGVGMAASAVAGEIKASADIIAYASSDERLKENIKPIENALDKISKISGNTFDWKSGYEEIHSHEGNDVGLIAQEIEAVLPQLVTTREHGFKAVQYDKLVALLVEGMKEQQKQIDELKSKLGYN